jgi:hypothetical protein
MNERQGELDVSMVHRGLNVAYLTDGRTVPVTHWFDSDGEICGPEHAVTFVAGHNDIGWFAVDLSVMKYVKVH